MSIAKLFHERSLSFAILDLTLHLSDRYCHLTNPESFLFANLSLSSCVGNFILFFFFFLIRNEVGWKPISL